MTEKNWKFCCDWAVNQIKEKKLLMEKLKKDLIALNREKSILLDKL